MPTDREGPVERNVCRQVEKLGGVAYKFTSPGRRGVPDRLVLKPLPDYLQELFRHYMYFVEAKAPGKALRPDQQNEKELLEGLGYAVLVVDDPQWGEPV